jgi:hypothetical protein
MSQNDHAARLREMADGSRRWSVAYEHETDPISQLRLKSLRSDAAALTAGADALERVAVLERELAEARKDSARLSHIIDQANATRDWLQDHVWDSAAELCSLDYDEADDVQKWVRVVIDKDMEGK